MALLASFFLYFLILLVIAVIFKKKQSTDQDFIVGSRSLNPYLTALSAHASDMSSWLFMAFPAAVYVGGLPGVWIAVGLVFGMLLNWIFVAKKLRVSTEQTNTCTIPSFFASQFPAYRGLIRIVAAFLSILFLTYYLSAGLTAMGRVLTSLFLLEYHVGLSIACLVSMLYILFGGYYTVAQLDLFQALFLLFALMVVPIVALMTFPEGSAQIPHAFAQFGKPLVLFENFWQPMLLSLGWGLGYFGQPHIITKFMGISNPDDIKLSLKIGMSWQLLSLFFASLVGVVGVAFFSYPLFDPEFVFVDMTLAIFPPFLAGLILCGILAANMSTMDSQMLVSASVISEDVFAPFFPEKANPRSLLLVTRISVVLVTIVCLGLALINSASLLESVHFAWTGLGLSFGPALLFILYYKRYSGFACLMTMLTGALFTFLWPLTPFGSCCPALVSGFIGCSIVGFACSFRK